MKVTRVKSNSRVAHLPYMTTRRKEGSRRRVMLHGEASELVVVVVVVHDVDKIIQRQIRKAKSN